MVPEGVVGRVPYKGDLVESIHQFVGGIRSGMGYCGCKNIFELQKNAKFIRITGAGLQESHPHNVMITKESQIIQDKFILQKNTIIFALFIFSCDLIQNKSDQILARVNDDYIFNSDLKKVFPENLSFEDILFTNNFINNWAKKITV